MSILTEAFTNEMKNSFSRAALTWIGNVLASQGVSVEQSTFIKVPPYRFRLGQALPIKTGDSKAYFGVVAAIRKSDDAPLVIIVTDSKKARYFELDKVSNYKTMTYKQGEPIKDFSTFVKDLKEVYISSLQSSAAEKRTKRAIRKDYTDRLFKDKSGYVKERIRDHIAIRKAMMEDSYTSKLIKQIESHKGFKVDTIALTNELSKDRYKFLKIDLRYTANTGIKSIDGRVMTPIRVKTWKINNENDKLNVEIDLPPLRVESDDLPSLDAITKYSEMVNDVTEVFKIIAEIEPTKLMKIDMYEE